MWGHKQISRQRMKLTGIEHVVARSISEEDSKDRVKQFPFCDAPAAVG